MACNSASAETGLDVDGLDTAAAKDAVVAWLEDRGLGRHQACCYLIFPSNSKY